MSHKENDRSQNNISLHLDGYSGYSVLLSGNETTGYEVIKQSVSEDKNSRLQHQHLKHVFFQGLSAAPFGVPVVKNHDLEKGLFKYTYCFIEGVSLIKKIEICSQDELVYLSEKIIKILLYFKESKLHYETPSEKNLSSYLMSKIEHNSKSCNLDSKIRNKLIEMAKSFVCDGQTLCHGDFTFDNIIVDSQNKLWLIDYLDVFPHYWLDISKLFQDLDGNWFEIKHNTKLPQNKLLFMRNYLFEKISRIDPEYAKYHRFLLAVSFLRILPYAKSTNDRDLILEKIKHCVEGGLV